MYGEEKPGDLPLIFDDSPYEDRCGISNDYLRFFSALFIGKSVFFYAFYPLFGNQPHEGELV